MLSFSMKTPLFITLLQVSIAISPSICAPLPAGNRDFTRHGKEQASTSHQDYRAWTSALQDPNHPMYDPRLPSFQDHGMAHSDLNAIAFGPQLGSHQKHVGHEKHAGHHEIIDLTQEEEDPTSTRGHGSSYQNPIPATYVEQHYGHLFNHFLPSTSAKYSSVIPQITDQDSIHRNQGGLEDIFDHHPHQEPATNTIQHYSHNHDPASNQEHQMPFLNLHRSENFHKQYLNQLERNFVQQQLNQRHQLGAASSSMEHSHSSQEHTIQNEHNFSANHHHWPDYLPHNVEPDQSLDVNFGHQTTPTLSSARWNQEAKLSNVASHSDSHLDNVSLEGSYPGDIVYGDVLHPLVPVDFNRLNQIEPADYISILHGGYGSQPRSSQNGHRRQLRNAKVYPTVYMPPRETN